MHYSAEDVPEDLTRQDFLEDVPFGTEMRTIISVGYNSSRIRSKEETGNLSQNVKCFESETANRSEGLKGLESDGLVWSPPPSSHPVTTAAAIPSIRPRKQNGLVCQVYALRWQTTHITDPFTHLRELGLAYDSWKQP